MLQKKLYLHTKKTCEYYNNYSLVECLLGKKFEENWQFIDS